MAKTKQTVKTVKKVKKRRAPVPPIPDHIKGHLRMITDPCGAPVVETIYSGATGIVQRFSLTAFTTGPAGVCTITPGGLLVGRDFPTNANTTFSPTYTNSLFPGYSFLSGVAMQARPVAACISAHWNSAEQARGGTIAFGCYQAANLSTTIPTTVAQVIAQMPYKQRVPAGELEILWNPAPFDADYVDVNGATPVTFNDLNQIGFAYEIPSGNTIAYTMTIIVEWRPKLNQGAPVPTTVTRSVPDAVSVLNNLLDRLGTFGNNVGSLSMKAATTMSSLYSGGTASYRLIKGATGMVTTLIP